MTPRDLRAEQRLKQGSRSRHAKALTPRGLLAARRLIKARAEHLALIELWPLNDSSQPDRSSSHP